LQDFRIAGKKKLRDGVDCAAASSDLQVGVFFIKSPSFFGGGKKSWLFFFFFFFFYN
jgi:hypothetical protein